MNPKSLFSKEKHIKILEGLLKLPENKECADCKSKAPRWASTNLGIFICLQCSGIHRSLGVHISKVRSTTLDTWLPEQVAFMQSMGNKKSNAYWESELPLNYDRGRIENFIRAKYVEKRWISRDCLSKSLSTNRPSRRFGRIAEWTNNQHLLCEERSDFSRDEKDRVGLSCDNDRVHKNFVGIEIEPKHQEKKNSQLLMDKSSSDLVSLNVKPYKELSLVSPIVASKKSEQVSKFRSSSVRATYVNPFDFSGWVQFDSEQEPSIQGAKSVVPKPAFEEEKLITKSSTRKIHPGPEIENVQTAMEPSTTGQIGQNQKDVTSNSQSLSKMSDTVSMSSIHYQRLAMLAQGISFIDAPKSMGNTHQLGINGLQKHEQVVNGGAFEHTTKTEIPMQSFQPAKLAVKSVPDATASLYRPGISFKSKSTKEARGPPSALPVSGYDYDFSFLTQGMFKKR